MGSYLRNDFSAGDVILVNVEKFFLEQQLWQIFCCMIKVSQIIRRHMRTINLKMIKRKKIIKDNIYYVSAVLFCLLFLVFAKYMKLLNRKVILAIAVLLMAATLCKAIAYVQEKIKASRKNKSVKAKIIGFRKDY